MQAGRQIELVGLRLDKDASKRASRTVDCEAADAIIKNLVNPVSRMKFATAINCMDGRIQLPVIAYLEEKCKVDYVDMVTEAGPVKTLADCRGKVLTDSMRRRVEISTTKHRSRHIAVVGHFDCAGNPVSKETQMKQILKSIKTVLSWNLKVEVRGLWVDEDWTVHEINEEL